MAPLALLALTLAACSSDPGEPRPAARPGAPNFVVVTTDDQDAASFNRALMPRTMKLVAGRGTRFTESVVSSPECCPSRATFISGQYDHNHGVFSNEPGYPDFVDKEETLPVWLQRAGYETALVGKFLNGYEPKEEPAPGFDEWHALIGENYFDFGVSVNGEPTHYGADPANYVTDVLTREAESLIERYAAGERPFFLWLTHVAPHSDRTAHGPCENAAIARARDLRAVAGLPIEHTAAFNETDTSDKPPALRSLDRLRAKEVVKAEQRIRCRWAALMALDRAIGRLVRTLRASGELERTVIVFTSDNGYVLGEHRLEKGKAFPYEPSLRVPLAIRVPRRYREGPQPAASDELVVNADLAPTILDLAGARPCDGEDCRVLDGRSLMPLVGGGGRWPSARVVPLELRDPRPSPRFPCVYQGVRSGDRVVVAYTEARDPATMECAPADTPQVEAYDLRSDPLQLENLGSGGSTPRLDRLLDRLSDCAGTAGPDGCL